MEARYSAKRRCWVTLFVFGALMLTVGVMGSGMDIAVYANSSEVVIYWDPSESFSNEVMFMQNAYETLLRYDPFEDTFTPLLATDYEVSEDGTTWTFYLREGVRFHTGGTMDAEAVKYSIDRTMDLGKGASFIWAPVTEVEVVDTYTVRFHLDYAAPLDLIASAAYAAYIFDPDYSDHEWFLQGNTSGTGPYKVESHIGAEEVLLTRFEDYWGGWEAPYYDKVLVQWVEEPSTRRMMLETGVADYTNILPVTDVEALRGVPSVEIVETPSFQNLLALFNTAKSEGNPIADPLVRKALAYTIPYDSVVEDVLGGYGEKARGVIPFGLWGHSDRVAQYTTSLETARALLAEAGYADGGFSLLLTYTSGNEDQRRMAELWRSELAKLNVSLEIRGLPWDAQIATGHAENPDDRQDVLLFYWWPDYAHPHSFLSAMFETLDPPLFNFSYYASPLFDALIGQAERLAATDRDEAINLYVEAQNLLMADAAGVAVYDVQYVRATSASLQGFVDNPAYPHVVFWYDCWRQ